MIPSDLIIPDGLTILFEDDDVMAVDKPAGLLSVPGRGADKYDSVQTRARELVAGASAIHRLDMATSGIMLVAKHKAAERHFKLQFEQRQVRKVYYAIASGLVEQDQGQMCWPLIADWPNRPRQKVCHDTGKVAITDYEVVGRVQESSSSQAQTLLRLLPLTGRSHQLRVHLATLGHPIIGDDLYHGPCDGARLMLHASELVITNMNEHPLMLYSQRPFEFPYAGMH